MAKETKPREQIMSFEPSTIKTIDKAMFDYINENMDLFTTTNKGWKKTPVKWVTSERIYHSKDDPERRDLQRTIILPLITLQRLGMSKNQVSKGTFYGWSPDDDKGGTITIANRIKQDKTANFQNADAKKKSGQINFVTSKKNNKVVYESISIPQPVYVDINYEITLRTEYQQQMNELLQPFITIPGSVREILIKNDCHTYEAFIQGDFNQNDNVANMDEEERRFETKINIKVYGYLVGRPDNDQKPRMVKRENAVEIKIGRERVILVDEIDD